MALDPRTPVLIGCGQFAQHTDSVETALDPVSMMSEATRLACSDAGLTSIPDPDLIAVVALLSWRYGDPAYLVGQQVGVTPGRTVLTTHGGNSPQSLVNKTALQIQNGEVDFAILTGGEASRTRAR